MRTAPPWGLLDLWVLKSAAGARQPRWLPETAEASQTRCRTAQHSQAFHHPEGPGVVAVPDARFGGQAGRDESNVRCWLCSCLYSRVTLLVPKLATHRCAPSKAMPKGLRPTGDVLNTAPVLRSSFITLLLPLLDTQRYVPSVAKPAGPSPTA